MEHPVSGFRVQFYSMQSYWMTSICLLKKAQEWPKSKRAKHNQEKRKGCVMSFCAVLLVWLIHLSKICHVKWSEDANKLQKYYVKFWMEAHLYHQTLADFLFSFQNLRKKQKFWPSRVLNFLGTIPKQEEAGRTETTCSRAVCATGYWW